MSFQQSFVQQNAFQIDVPGGAGASALDDGDTSWWGGVQQCAVGVARGLAVAALGLNVAIAGTLSNAPQDEIARPNADASYASFQSPNQRARISPVMHWWVQDDELPAPVVVKTDEGGSLPPSSTRLQHKPVFNRWYAQDELPSPVLAADDGDWRIPVPQTAPPKATVFTDDADQQLSWTLDEPYNWTAQWIPAKLQIPDQNWDSEALFWPLEDDSGWAAPVGVAGFKAVQPWVDDDFVPTVATLAVDEEGWQAPKYTAPKLQTDIPVDDQALSWYLDEVYTWTPQWVAAKNQISGPTWDDQAFEPVIDDPYQWVPPSFTQTVVWRAPWTDDLFVPAGTLVADEDGWSPQATPPNLSIVVWSEDDLIVPQPQSQGSDQASSYPSSMRARSQPVFMRWYAQDERPTPATFTPVEEDQPMSFFNAGTALYTVWAENEEIVPQPPVQSGAGGGAPWVYGQRARHETRFQLWPDTDVLPPPTPFREEDYWQVYTPPRVPAKFVYLPDPEVLKVTAPTPLQVDQDYWLTFQPAQKPINVAALPAYYPADDEFAAIAHFCWVPVDTAQTAGWGLVSNTQTPSWAAVTTNQTPNWSDIDDTQC